MTNFTVCKFDGFFRNYGINGPQKKKIMKRSGYCDGTTVEWCRGNQEGKKLQGGGNDQLTGSNAINRSNQ